MSEIQPTRCLADILGQKVFYFDTETDGLDREKNSPWQIAIIVEIPGKRPVEHEFRCQPLFPQHSSQKAFDVSGVSAADIAKLPTPFEIMPEFIGMLSSYIDRFDPTDKFIMAGYNTSFDKDMLFNWFRCLGQGYFHSWFHKYYLCMYHFMSICHFFCPRLRSLQNLRLGTVCEILDIQINAHDAMSDIRATREIAGRLSPYFKHLSEMEILVNENSPIRPW